MLRRIKYICTIGPSTWDSSVIKELIDLGMVAARVNGAFADPAELDKVKSLIRQYSETVSLMLDVKGPEIRLNKFPTPLKVKPGEIVKIGSRPEHGIYPYNYPQIYKLLKKGKKIVIGDGDVVLEVEKIDEDQGIIYAQVVRGEVIKPGKALSLPGVSHSEQVLTEKDIINLRHALSTGWDMVSASFIKNKESALEVRRVIGDRMTLVAKIEDREGVRNIDEILEVADAIMVARGGLGVDLGLKFVPVVERELVKKANHAGKPVIIATQLLETMTYNPYPTRAEVNDIETAVFLGADALMLSGETAGGAYPIEALRVLDETARFAWEYVEKYRYFDQGLAPISTIAIANAAVQLTQKLASELKAVVVVSKSGTTARLIARANLSVPIYVFTGDNISLKRLNLTKGVVRAFILPQDQDEIKKDREKAIRFVLDFIRDNKLASSGDKLLLVGKTPITKVPFFPNIFEVLEV